LGVQGSKRVHKVMSGEIPRFCMLFLLYLFRLLDRTLSVLWIAHLISVFPVFDVFLPEIV
jgi:hypothetical protein